MNVLIIAITRSRTAYSRTHGVVHAELATEGRTEGREFEALRVHHLDRGNAKAEGESLACLRERLPGCFSFLQARSLETR